MRVSVLAFAFTACAANLFAQSQCNWTPGTNITETCGKVGIGVAFPATTLHVDGGGIPLSGSTSYNAVFRSDPTNALGVFLGYDSSGQIGVVGALASAPSSLAFWTYGSAWAERLRIDGNGNVGIGSIPVTRLHVDGTGIQLGSSTGYYNSIFRSDPTNARGVFLGYDTSGQIGVIGSLASGPSTLGFWTYGNTGWGERLRIDGNGNIGIGINTASGYKLDVSGDAHFQGTVTGSNIRAMYQDLAEWVPATGDMLPGIVVVLDPEHENSVRPCSQAYDPKVAGVVSASPGITLGEPSADKAKVATTGRVKVRVDATKRPIRIGDLLVTSDEPGFAMASEPIEVNGQRFHRPGTIVGKALQPLQSGQGEILALLSLQ